MIQAFFTIITLVYYVSILVELLVLAVPSPVSTYQIVQEKEWSRLSTVMMSVPALLAFMLPLLSVVLSFFGMSILSLSNHTLLLIVSISLILMGRVFTLWGTLNIRKHLNKKNSSILKTGIFSISRHPIATGLFISLFGFNLAFVNVFLLLLSVFFVINLNAKVLLEENLLLQEYPLEYESYQQQTRRYL